MKKTVHALFITGMAIVGTLSLYACNTQAPLIFLEAPEEGSEIFAGYDVHFAALLQDKVGLSGYSVQITEINGETDHGEDTVPFDYLNSWDIEGEKEAHLHQHDIIVPHNAATGNYLFTLTCTNQKGRQSQVSVSVVVVKLEE